MLNITMTSLPRWIGAFLIGCATSGGLPVAVAQTPLRHAGIASLEVASDTPNSVLVWYPTDADETPSLIGKISVPASRDTPVAEGKLPVILLDHGGGPGGGSPLILRELSASLARQGYLVVAPFHGKTGLAHRPMQVRRALDAVLADPRFAPHADVSRLGMVGFSLVGAVTLELAGATPNTAYFESYCRAHPADVMSCGHAPDQDAHGERPKRGSAASDGASATRLPLKAIALLDPLAALFDRSDLRAITVPVLILRPLNSELPGEGNAMGLARALPQPPKLETLPGGHFVFTDVCSPPQRAAAPEVCVDPLGTDRVAAHPGIESAITKFFQSSLGE
ncbi:alpha/beta hydrolase family protein [Acidovorax sacchari]|uniref:alpha/beta hydrolase family protein n=2 Tax=Acidovorax sacchari TaxID=3230736 RepID=UPI0039E49F7B